jgi:AmmeMemoRadiSam system protein B
MSDEPNIEYPRLRGVEAIPTKDDLICLRDPLGYSERLVLLPREALFVVSLFDGEHSVIDVQSEFARRFGSILPAQRVREIIEQLDDCLFLDSNRFRETRRAMEEAFHNAQVRQATHAGNAYEAETDALRLQLGELFAGVGPPAGDEPPTGDLRALIAPHIDVHRGGPCFASSYAELGRAAAAVTFIVLGIAHVPTRRRFALCAKDFATPLGTLPLDRDFLAALEGRLHNDFYEDEFVHRSEHSIEFQTLFLQYLYGGKRPVSFVPILCGGLEQATATGLPEDDPEVRDFLQALRETLAEHGQSVCCIAGVDLSHLGRRFGQELTLDKSFLQRAEAEDRRMIEKILARDAEGFFRLIQAERDGRNVCGVPAIYALLRLLEELDGRPTAGDGPNGQPVGNQPVGNQPVVTPGRLLRYEQAVEQSAQSVVTFMGAAFYG